jgi:DNA-binding response OmpR family regulator
LLVDDEEEFVETLADRLQMRDLEASTAHNGEEALSVVKEDEPDVIVRRVKKAYPRVEVIILTGHGSQKDEEAARSLGAFDYVTKPADLDKLVPRIKDAFKHRMKKLESMSMAVAFAEAGEFDTAKQMMEDDDEQPQKKKKKRKKDASD